MQGERGFTLLEVLVAFVITSLALAALYHGTLAGLTASGAAGQKGEAISRARSRLATVGHAGPVVAGEQSGDDGGGWRWRVQVTLAGLAPVARGDASEVARGPHVALYAVTVWVGRGDGGPSAQLGTQVVDTAPLPPPP